MPNENNNKKKSPVNNGGGHHGIPAQFEKPKQFKNTMKKLFDFIKPFYIKIIFTVFFSVISAVFAIVAPKILSNVTNVIFDGSTTGSVDFNQVKKYCILMIIIYLISNFSLLLQGVIMSDVAQKISYKLRQSISEKISRIPLKYYDGHSSGDVLSRITNDVDTVSNTLNQSMSQIITSVTMVIGIVIMMLTISVTMTIIAFLIIPLSMIAVKFIITRSQKFYKSQQALIGEVNGQVEELYGGHSLVKVFNGEEHAIEEFSKTNQKLYKVGVLAQFFGGIMMPVMIVIGNFGYVCVCILGGFLAAKGSISVGSILAFIQYIKNFTQPLNQVSQIANVLQSTAAAAERVFEFLDEKELITEEDKTVNLKEINGGVEFNNVSFGYTEDKIIINNFTAKIKEGQKVAIVGPTGAGKTTIVKLLMRFYEINEGSIFIDGNNITEITRSNLREMFGMVLQDTWLFQGTILENLRFGKLDATDEEVKTAAKMAHAHSFIKTQPEGYNFIINEEGTNISVGQKQLLTIARALLRDPKVLILDEATSSVDTRTEILIQKAMENLMKGRTSFVIAHRLSTIKDSDVILVMDKGDIVEIGNHHQLIENKGFYYNLYNSQFENQE